MILTTTSPLDSSLRLLSQPQASHFPPKSAEDNSQDSTFELVKNVASFAVGALAFGLITRRVRLVASAPMAEASTSAALQRVRGTFETVWDVYKKHSSAVRVVGGVAALYDLTTNGDGQFVGWDGKFDHWYGAVGATLLWNFAYGHLTCFKPHALDVSIPTTFATKYMFAVLAGGDSLYIDNYNSYFWFHTLSTATSFWQSALVSGRRFTRPELFEPHAKLLSKNYVGLALDKIFGGLVDRLGIKSISGYAGKSILGSPFVTAIDRADPLKVTMGITGKTLFTLYSLGTMIPMNMLGASLILSDPLSFGGQRFWKLTAWSYFGQPIQTKLNNNTSFAQLFGRLIGLAFFDFPIALFQNPHILKRFWSPDLRGHLNVIADRAHATTTSDTEHANKTLAIFADQMQLWTLRTTSLALFRWRKPGEYQTGALRTFVDEIHDMTVEQRKALEMTYFLLLDEMKLQKTFSMRQRRALAVLTSILTADPRFSVRDACRNGIVPTALCLLPEIDGERWEEAIYQLNHERYDTQLLSI